MWRRFAFLAGVMLSLGLAGCSGPTKPKPTELAQTPMLMSVARVWEAKWGEIDFELEPKVIGSHVIVASGEGVVRSIDAGTGGVRWATPVGNRIVAGVGADGDKVAFVSAAGELGVLDEGKPLWKQKLGALAITAPLVAGGRVFVATPNKTVMAFDLVSGKKLWQVQRETDVLTLGKSGVLLPFGDTLLVGAGGRLLGLNPSTGAQRWEMSISVSRATNEVERLLELVSGVSRVGSSICVRGYRSNVACVDATTTKLIWSKPANGVTGVGGDANTVIGAEADGRLIAWRRRDGELLWQSDSFKWRDLGAPVVLGASVAVPDSAGFVHLVSVRDGSVLGRLVLDGSPLAASPVLAGKTLIIVTQKGGVFAFRPE
jgi:outer membrane protein assembly factor BamB